jgi:hypothetical protein
MVHARLPKYGSGLHHCVKRGAATQALDPPRKGG